MIKSIIFLILASLVHFACFLFILLPFVTIKKIDYFKIINTIFIVLSIFAVFKTILLGLLDYIPNSELQATIKISLRASSLKFTNVEIMRYIFKMLIVFALSAFMYFYIKKVFKSKTNIKLTNCYSVIKMCERINYYCLLLLPLSFFTAEVFRAQMTLMIVNYIAAGIFIMIENKNNLQSVYTSKSFAVLGISVSQTAAALYFWVLSNNNINTVFKPLFENNSFMRLLEI